MIQSKSDPNPINLMRFKIQKCGFEFGTNPFKCS